LKTTVAQIARCEALRRENLKLLYAVLKTTFAPPVVNVAPGYQCEKAIMKTNDRRGKYRRFMSVKDPLAQEQPHNNYDHYNYQLINI